MYAVSSYLVGVGDATTQLTETNLGLGVDLEIRTVGIGNGDTCFTPINLFSTIITDLHFEIYSHTNRLLFILLLVYSIPLVV